MRCSRRASASLASGPPRTEIVNSVPIAATTQQPSTPPLRPSRTTRNSSGGKMRKSQGKSALENIAVAATVIINK